MSRTLEWLRAVSAIFAFTALGVCTVRIAFLADSAGQVIARLDATVTDLNRTIQITAGMVNEARDIARDNRKDIATANRKTVQTLGQLRILLADIDQSQKRAADSITETSDALVPMIRQITVDLVALQPTIAELQPAVQQVTPLLTRTSDIALNVSQATADLEHEIHKLVYPPPRTWYQKYFLDPIRTAAHLVTIPVR